MMSARGKFAAIAVWALSAAALGTVLSAAWIVAEAAQEGPDRIAEQAKQEAAASKAETLAGGDRPEPEPEAPAGMMAGGQMGGMMGGMMMANHAQNSGLYLEIALLSAELNGQEEGGPNQAVFETLNTKIKVKLPKQTSLQFAIKYIQGAIAKAGRPALPIYLDLPGALVGQRGMMTNIEIDLENVPLRTSLRWLLKQMGLAYCVRDGVLFVGSARSVRDELAEGAARALADDPDGLGQPTQQLLQRLQQGKDMAGINGGMGMGGMMMGGMGGMGMGGAR